MWLIFLLDSTSPSTTRLLEKAYIPQMALLEETRLEKVILDKQNLDRQKERGIKLL